MFASGIMLAIVIAVISLTYGDRSDRKLYDAINATERGFFETPVHVKYKGGDCLETTYGSRARYWQLGTHLPPTLQRPSPPVSVFEGSGGGPGAGLVCNLRRLHTQARSLRHAAAHGQPVRLLQYATPRTGEDPHSFRYSLFLLEASAICEYPL